MFNNFCIQLNQDYQIKNKMIIDTADDQFAGNIKEHNTQGLESAVTNFVQGSAAERTFFSQLTDNNATLN